MFLNRSFWPDLEATGQLLTELCEDLSANHEITFVAGPSYHVGATPRRPWARERLGRVSIVRTWGTRLPKTRLPLRLTNLATYYALAAMAAMTGEKPDVVIAQTDPPLLGVLGAMLKRRWGCRLIYNVRDLYPDIARATGEIRNGFLLGLLEHANRHAYRWADRIVVLGGDMAERVLARGVPRERVVVVPDWADCDRIRPLERNPLRVEFGDKFVVMYSGNLGLSQQLETVLDAAQLLRDDRRILFVMIGEGARKRWLIDRAHGLGLENVTFRPYLPKERLAASLGAADLHLIPLSERVAGCLVPSKVYSILAAGRPFIAMMESTAEVARIAAENSVGFVCPPGDPPALARSVEHAISARGELMMMSRRARRLAVSRFDRKIVTKRFADVLAELATVTTQPFWRAAAD